MRRARTARDGYDRIGPFHPKLVWAAILLAEIAFVAAVVTAFVWVGDKVEDQIAPGGDEWVAF